MKRYIPTDEELEIDQKFISQSRSAESLYQKARTDLEKAKTLEDFDYLSDYYLRGILPNNRAPFFRESECDTGISREVRYHLKEDIRTGVIRRPSYNVGRNFSD